MKDYTMLSLEGKWDWSWRKESRTSNRYTSKATLPAHFQSSEPSVPVLIEMPSPASSASAGVELLAGAPCLCLCLHGHCPHPHWCCSSTAISPPATCHPGLSWRLEESNVSDWSKEDTNQTRYTWTD